jgi:hypothetical protein
MWHKFGRSEYYALGSADTVIDGTVAALKDGEGRKTWEEGDRYCKALGATMVSISDLNEMEFAISLTENNRHGFWLGMERIDDLFPEFPLKKGFESWLDGTLVGWANWAEGEPNSPRYGTKSGELVDTYVDKCAFQGINQGDPSLWNDASCEKRRRVICERPLADAFANDNCNGVRDPPGCDSYYDAQCHDIMGTPTQAYDMCAVKCSSCLTTTTTFVSTTTSFATTTTTQAPSTTTSVVTTTTSFATTTTSFQTTSSTIQTTTSTFRTTTTTAEATTSTTGTTTTGAPSTTTTEAPITDEPLDLGVCMQTPAKGWHSINNNPNKLFAPVVPGGEDMHCCYKYINKPRVSWDRAQAICEAVGDEYPLSGSFAGLASAYVPAINNHLTNVLYQNEAYTECDNLEASCRNKANGESTWLGGKTLNGSQVKWTNPFFAAYNDEDYGANSTTEEYHFDYAGGHEDDNGMFYLGEPSQLNMNNGRTGTSEDCLSQGGDRKRVKQFGISGWNDAKCNVRKGYFCEYCVRQGTTTTFEPTTTTSGKASTTTTVAPTSTTTQEPTTTTTMARTTTTTAAPTSTTTVELTSTTTYEPTTTTTAAPDCASISCAGECGIIWEKGDREYTEFCGWSKKYNACVPGGRTTEKEKFMGECGTTTTTAKPQLPAQNCASTYCSSTCGYGNGNNAANNCQLMVSGTCTESECGWSRKYDRCIEGGFTNSMEANSNLGPKCP